MCMDQFSSRQWLKTQEKNCVAPRNKVKNFPYGQEKGAFAHWYVRRHYMNEDAQQASLSSSKRNGSRRSRTPHCIVPANALLQAGAGLMHSLRRGGSPETSQQPQPTVSTASQLAPGRTSGRTSGRTPYTLEQKEEIAQWYYEGRLVLRDSAAPAVSASAPLNMDAYTQLVRELTQGHERQTRNLMGVCLLFFFLCLAAIVAAAVVGRSSGNRPFRGYR